MQHSTADGAASEAARLITARETEGQGPAGPVARQKEWFDDLIGSFDCCGPTLVGSMTTGSRRSTGNVRRGFSTATILKEEGVLSSEIKGAKEASRSTIGPLNAGGPWEFDDASPDTWPDDITYTYLTARPNQQSLHIAASLASDALVSGTATPNDIVQAREL